MPEIQVPLTLVPEESSTKANMNGAASHETRSQPNGNPKGSDTIRRTRHFDPNFTQHVIDTIGPKTSPRMRKVMASLIQHIHDFARENEVTVDEWMAGVEFVC